MPTEEIGPSTSWSCFCPCESALLGSLCRGYPLITAAADDWTKRKEFQTLSQDVLTPQRHLSCCYPKGLLCTRTQSQEAVAYLPRRKVQSTTVGLCWSSRHCWNFLPVMPCSNRAWRKVWVKGMHFHLLSDRWSHHSWPETGVQSPWADHARIHTRTTRGKSHGEQGKLRALSGVEDFRCIIIGSSKPSTWVSWKIVLHSQHLCRNSSSFLCQIAFMWNTLYMFRTNNSNREPGVLSSHHDSWLGNYLQPCSCEGSIYL